ncbi:MAG: hypothetical protein ACE5H2_03655 [Terriglobia bacterium]
MTETNNNPPTRPNETLLESWKEIAAYLKRDVRTVIRWEKSEGLPVRRHLHQARSSVYAYPSELDAWWATRRPRLQEAPPWRRPVPALALTAVLLLALLSAGSGPILTPVGAAAGESGDGMVARQVWAPAGDAWSVSPDDRYLIFIDWDTGDLAVRDLTTGENRRLTDKGEWSESDEFAEVSRVSPDGQQIAYGWFNGDRYDLRLVGLDGSGLRVLYSNEDVDYVEPGAWSPDGKSICATVTKWDRTNQIVLVSVADGSAKVLKTTDWRHPHVGQFSPDGRTIVYDFPPEEGSPARDIFLLATDGSRELRLVEHPANDRVLGWTPNGKRLLFSSDRTGTNGVWVIPVAEGKPQGSPALVKPAIGSIRPLGFTQEGNFYYGLGTGIRDAYIAPLDPVTGKVVADAEPVSQRYVGSNRMPAWSPDGKSIAYLRTRNVSALGGQLVIRSVASGEEREFPLKLTVHGPFSPPCWSSDGRSVLVTGTDSKGRQGFYRVDVETGEVTPFVRSEPRVTSQEPAWSPDGNVVFYLLRRDRSTKSSSIVRREVETGQEKELYRAVPPAFVSNFALSPDGQRLVFRGGEDYAMHDVLDVLKVMPATGGEPRDLMRVPVAEYHNISGIAGLAWTPDGAHLLFGRWRNWSADGRVELWRVPAAGGEPQKLGLAMEGLRGVRIHPDGRRIAFTAGSDKGEVWVLENFLPERKTEK